MPPKNKFTKDEIIQAALEITRKDGFEAVSARAVAQKLNSSTKVIFGFYQNMGAFLDDVKQSANAAYESFMQAHIRGELPYKASGMAYIRFAQEEKELFRLLFMRDRSQETVAEDRKSLRPLLKMIEKSTGLDEDSAYLFHIEMWIFVHGIATMYATHYLELDWALISDMLTDCFEGLKVRFQTKERKNGSD